MKRYELTPELRTGNGMIDTEHQRIFDEANALLEACKSGHARGQIGEIAEFLSDYVGIHFADEEELQTQYRYPDYEKHKKFHEWYKNDLRSKLSALKTEKNTFQALGKINQAMDTLLKHIQTEDSRLAKWVREKDGAEPEPAIEPKQPVSKTAVVSTNKKEKENERTADSSIFKTEIPKVREAVNQIKIRARGLEQTAAMEKMLSLNAAIEAGRAGKAGVGFAVVAEEIGRTANESARVYREIQELVLQIEESMERMER